MHQDPTEVFICAKKLTSSILVATRQTESKLSFALAAPRIRVIREIRVRKKLLVVFTSRVLEVFRHFPFPANVP